MSVETTRPNYKIEEVNFREVNDEQIREMTDFGNVLKAEALPDDPPSKFEVVQASVRNIPPFAAIFAYWARAEDGALVGTAEGSYWGKEDNQHLLFSEISIHPDHRQKGLAKQLLRKLVEVAEAEDRSWLMGASLDRIEAGGAFCKRVGAEAGQQTHINRLVLADVDMAMVARWVDEGKAKAADFDLEFVDGPYPDEDIEAIIEIFKVMNTAPRDDLKMDDWTTTVEKERAVEASAIARGAKRLSVFARHRESGELAGFSELSYQPKMPLTAHQLGTAVHPKFRGAGIGKWMKAVMLQRVREEWPEALDIRTQNADSNDSMLAINNELGFKPYMAQTFWQAPVDKIREYCD